jgi:hypothetical protein
MSLIIFDIDGVVADNNHRLHHIKQKPKNWKAFNEGLPNDTLIESSKTVYDALVRSPYNTIVFVTGRSEDERKDTETWLAQSGFDRHDGLFMRRARDYRPAPEVKREILRKLEELYGKKPDMVFEDSPRVNKMWREEGIWVYDCNQSQEDF